MSEKFGKPAVVLGFLLALILPILGIAGYMLHQYVYNAFAQVERVESAEWYSQRALSLQLDIETGIRGYINTEDPQFLQPFHSGIRQIDDTFDQLRVALRGADLGDFVYKVDDAQLTSQRWRTQVAAPFVHVKHPRAMLLSFSRPRQQRGKALIDRIRSDLKPIAAALTEKRLAVASSAREAIDRIGEFVLGVTLIAAALLYFFLNDRARLARELELAEEESRRERERAEATRIKLETEKGIAETLQEALSQRPLPNLSTVHFSAMYMPAEEEAMVGGDWYDAIELSPECALFTIGDVAGHGIKAAVGMSRARQEFIGSALRNRDPAEILQHVNKELVREGSPMVTAVCGIADAARYEFVFATAGHPPPVLIEPGRPPRILECGGLPLGVIGHAEYRKHIIQTVPGALLVLYTDGAIEHSHSVLEGEELLLRAAAASVDQSELDPATAIHRGIFAERAAGDDVAILTIGFASDVASGMKISVERLQNSFSGQLRNPNIVNEPNPGKQARVVPLLGRRLPRLVSVPERRAS